MILDDLSRAALYTALSPGIAAALEYLRATDFSAVADGKHPVGETGVIAIVSRYRTKLPADAVWESHRRNIDVQYVAMGTERFGFVPLDRAPPVKTPYSDEKDIQFYEPGADTLRLAAGQFAVFFPQDIHAPSLADGAPGEVLKVIMKVPVA